MYPSHARLSSVEGVRRSGGRAKAPGGAGTGPRQPEAGTFAANVLALQRQAGNAAVAQLVADIRANHERRPGPSLGVQRATAVTAPTLAGTTVETGHKGVFDNGIITKWVRVEIGGKMRRLPPGTYVEVLSNNTADSQYWVKVWSGHHGKDAQIPADAFRHEPQADDVRDSGDYITDAHKVNEAVRFKSIAGVLWDPAAGPRLSDVHQGALGDCYLMAALASQALGDPEKIKDMFEDREPGLSSYGVRLWLNKSGDRPVRMTIRVSTNFAAVVKGKGLKPVYAAPASAGGQRHTKGAPILWPLLLEKGMGEVLGGFQELGEGGGDGRKIAAFTAITGMAPVLKTLSQGEGHDRVLGPLNEGLDSDDLGTLNDASLLRALHHLVAAGAIVNVWSRVTTGNDKDLLDAVANVHQNHIYAVRAVYLSLGTIILRNPWGEKHPKPLTVDQFRKCFREVQIGARTGINRQDM